MSTLNTNGAGRLVGLLAEKGLSVSTAESCTGGLLSSALVDVAGASAVFSYGFITYANEAKAKILGVAEETLIKYGAVSEETAGEMAIGAARESSADLAVSVSGIAGPDGGTKEKPVGTVCFGRCCRGELATRTRHFSGDRRMIREQAVNEAIAFCLEALEA